MQKRLTITSKSDVIVNYKAMTEGPVCWSKVKKVTYIK